MAYRSHPQVPAVNPDNEVQAIHVSVSVGERGKFVLKKDFHRLMNLRYINVSQIRDENPSLNWSSLQTHIPQASAFGQSVEFSVTGLPLVTDSVVSN